MKEFIATMIFLFLGMQFVSNSQAYFPYPDPRKDCEGNTTSFESKTSSSKKEIQPKPKKQIHLKTVDAVEIKLTGYYGPNPDQDDYEHGSYEKEVEVNGEGKVTAYGTKPRYGIVATDPRIFPKGTLLVIKDPRDGKEKIFKAEDKGGKIKGKKVDLFSGFGTKGLKLARKINNRRKNIILAKVVKLVNAPV